MDSRVQNGRTNVMSIRLFRPTDRGSVARQRGLSRGTKDRVGFETAQGAQPSQRGSVYRALLPERVEDLSALTWRGELREPTTRTTLHQASKRGLAELAPPNRRLQPP